MQGIIFLKWVTLQYLSLSQDYSVVLGWVMGVVMLYERCLDDVWYLTYIGDQIQGDDRSVVGLVTNEYNMEVLVTHSIYVDYKNCMNS